MIFIDMIKLLNLLNESPEINKKLSSQEQKIVDDILNSLNEGFEDVLNKVKDYTKKNLLTTGVLTALMFSPQLSPAQKAQIKQTANIEVSQDQVNDTVWRTILKNGSDKFADNLAKEAKLDKETIKKSLEPVIQSMYSLRPFLINDMTNNKGNISNKTKTYVDKNVLPQINKAIDIYWEEQNFVKKNTFKLFTKGKENQIKRAIDGALTSFLYKLAAAAGDTNSDNLAVILYSLQDYMGGEYSKFGDTVANKLNSLKEHLK